MRITPSRLVNGNALVAITILVVALSCESPTYPPHTDVDFARQTWLESRPSEYTFEIEFRSAMLPPTGYNGVHVRDGVVVYAADSAGRPFEDFSTTIDTVWTSLLNARARGELNSASFNWHGVPVEVDIGQWELDGGWHTSVRNFVRLR